MRFKNYTDFPDEDIRKKIDLVKPSGVRNFKITIYNARSGTNGLANANRNEVLIRLAMPNIQSYPYIRDADVKKTKRIKLYYESYNEKREIWQRWKVSRHVAVDNRLWKKTGYLPFLILSREEELVNCLAHELRHLWQAKVKKGYRVWGVRGQFSDRDADAYAIRKVRAWRRWIQSQLVVRDLKDLSGCSRFKEFFENIARSALQDDSV